VNRTGRYAPSPSGELHLGNLRTALLAWLFARSQGAELLLRVEDLDRQRSREEFVAGQLADLRALGIDWDGELPRQSGRADAYEGAIGQLRSAGLVYECFCTRREIQEAASAPHGEQLPDGFYPGTCLELTEAEREARRAERPAALRVRAEAERIRFHDRLHGACEGLVDDFVVRRNDGGHGYNLAVALDDATQGIGEVVRGRDLLDSTPRQIWIQRRLRVGEVASWAHVPLLLGPDGERLAKRHGDVTLGERLALGQTPEQVLGELAASLAIWPEGEAATIGELLDGFDPAALPTGDTRLSERQ
jgi:glutamyl-tRNA synthetase